MNHWLNLPPRLTRLGTYASPLGGSRKPTSSEQNEVLFEIIQEGSVYGLEETPVLHGESAVFCHQGGQISVSDSPPGSYYNCYVVWFECAQDGFPSDWPRVFQWKDRKSMHTFMEEMLHAFHYAALDRDVIGNLILSRFEFELERSRSLARTQAVPTQLSLATDFINRNYAKPLSLEDVAKAADVSVSHLHMLFRAHLGESPHQYLIQKRLRIAGHTLATGNLSIKVVATEVGYPNAENFCRAFRKFFGRSASEYRQAYSR
ncbi:helix-turn-helix domain-containing protein [Rariglobus hedericola]|uniref:Helix-turn-helix transcriptional regulator n=1 Tax=Rariglobus hedericola TaxID=2597822 RepID=A0A556QLK3_9BACT|nr:AraC family transcriptional regulator [Rariglobus hedericola]TSJ77472.1 helix-turn-helix transcriptional regulator [Rariglobus hedericola]